VGGVRAEDTTDCTVLSWKSLWLVGRGRSPRADTGDPAIREYYVLGAAAGDEYDHCREPKTLFDAPGQERQLGQVVP
jgi:hypothetical protein